MINELLRFCDGAYARHDRCATCPNQCQGSCEKCLDAIHFSRVERPYNCGNIAYFYTCKYCYKYASEIDILLSHLASLPDYGAFNVLSIGCGPCTELVGLHMHVQRARFRKPLTYLAFEMNDVWQPIHSFYEQYFANSGEDVSLQFLYEDAHAAIGRLNLTNNEWRPNILILQYVLSDMNKARLDIGLFLDDLIRTVIDFMPVNSYVIVNDINHLDARQWFDVLEGKFASRYSYSYYKGHFRHRNRDVYDYGNQHPSNALTCDVSESIVGRYNPWQFCSSAHLVLKKRGPL